MTFYNFVARLTYKAGRLHSKLLCWNPKVRIGKGTIIEPGVTLTTQYGGSITIGKDCYISRNAALLTHGGDIVIGNNCTINCMSTIYGQGGGKNW